LKGTVEQVLSAVTRDPFKLGKAPSSGAFAIKPEKGVVV